ncbi:3-deoxy-D-manno-octulosonic acid kinase [Halomonas sp. V046]|uniref:3-deoxy-D-manno-octulosonic acid kinase n=1 Tax=Halomonas sp. V046 TaxID=3459611 RepID=UPI004043C38F
MLPVGPELLAPDFWQDEGLVTGQAPGRGQSLFVAVGHREWVLRPYRRGGLIARLSSSRYVWTGLEGTRAFRELRLTAELFDAGLPVPRPILAGVIRHGLTYEAALITERLPAAVALAERLAAGTASDALLETVGGVIRRFHDHGLDHVDLNARNLLIDHHDGVWLIDFDRCRLREGGRLDERGTGRLNERGTGRLDERGTGRLNEPGTGRLDERGTGRLDEPGTGRLDERSTGRLNERGRPHRQDAWRQANLNRLGRSFAKFCASSEAADDAMQAVRHGYAATASD